MEVIRNVPRSRRRNLERDIATILRKIATKIVKGKEDVKPNIEKKRISMNIWARPAIVST